MERNLVQFPSPAGIERGIPASSVLWLIHKALELNIKRVICTHLWTPSEQPFINCSRYFRAPHWKSMGLPEIHQRTQNAIITLLWRRNDVATSFWRHNDVIIASCVRWARVTWQVWRFALCCVLLWLGTCTYHVLRVTTPVMTISWHGNNFLITGPLWGESTGQRWIPLTRSQYVELWRSLLC